jgi:hypothetical protein
VGDAGGFELCGGEGGGAGEKEKVKFMNTEMKWRDAVTDPPELNTLVLVWGYRSSEGGEPHHDIGYRDTEGFVSEDETEVLHVTHWMPRPDPPEATG